MVSRFKRGRWLLGGAFEDLFERRGQRSNNRSGIRDFALQPGDRADATVLVMLRAHRVRAHGKRSDQEQKSQR